MVSSKKGLTPRINGLIWGMTYQGWHDEENRRILIAEDFHKNNDGKLYPSNLLCEVPIHEAEPEDGRSQEWWNKRAWRKAQLIMDTMTDKIAEGYYHFLDDDPDYIPSDLDREIYNNRFRSIHA